MRGRAGTDCLGILEDDRPLSAAIRRNPSAGFQVGLSWSIVRSVANERRTHLYRVARPRCPDTGCGPDKSTRRLSPGGRHSGSSRRRFEWLLLGRFDLRAPVAEWARSVVL